MSEKIVKISEYLAKLEVTAWLSHALCMPGQLTAKRRRKNIHLTANLIRNLPVKW